MPLRNGENGFLGMKDGFENALAWTSDAPIGLRVDRAQGPYLYLEDGSRVIDLISGIAVSSVSAGSFLAFSLSIYPGSGTGLDYLPA